MLETTFFGIALVATVAGIALFRRYGSALGTLDIPNERSSHTTPTLRGGGIVIVAVSLLLFIGLSATGLGRANWPFVAGALIVAVVSWIDDGFSLPAWVRFIAHSGAAVMLIGGAGPLTGLALPGFGSVIFAPWISYGLTFLWIVWMINAYNFMDGIDGIAGAQGVVAGVAWAAVGLWLSDPAAYIFAGVIAFVSLGFLIHNWSPARVFMGDVGSAFLGYTFAAMPLIVEADPDRRPWLFTAAISFVWMFVFDTVFTLVRRLSKKEKVWLAHRKHIYQRLVISGWGHGTVSLIYGGLSLLVSAAFIAAFVFGGIAVPLLFFIYALAPAGVAFPAFRKKV
jgi:Fuc2NAc and GlcNAc transferase